MYACESWIVYKNAENNCRLQKCSFYVECKKYLEYLEDLDIIPVL